MPYASNADLPKAIRDKYGRCASAFRGAFNSTYDKTGSESKAFGAAHSAAQRCQRKESSMTLISTARLSPEIKAPKFNIITKAMAGETDEAGRRRFKATASSTITDRQGDEISLEALKQMARSFREGITIFTDHKNEVANAFGTTDSAQIIQRGHDAKTGEPIYDLDIGGTVNEPNAAMVQLHESITGGYVKLGCSIDAFVLEHEPKQAGRYSVKSIDVFAASIVGVPANQRSWTQKAVRAIKSFYGEPEEDDVLITDHDGIEVSLEEPTTSSNTISSKVVIKNGLPEGGNWLDQSSDNLLSNESTTAVLETPEEPPAEAPAEEPEDETKADDEKPDDGEVEKAMDDKCPDCGKGHDAEGCSNSYHSTAKSVDGEGGQESASETPETAPTDDAVTDTPIEEKATSVSAEDVRGLLAHVERLVKEIEGLRAERATLIARAEALESENKAVLGEVELAKQVIGKVMEQPLRSKTAAYVTEFTDVHQLFDPDVADYLTKRSRI